MVNTDIILRKEREFIIDRLEQKSQFMQQYLIGCGIMTDSEGNRLVGSTK